jgi:hypothetical protein
MLAVGNVLERLLKTETFEHLAIAQREAMAAVESIRPTQFKDRFVCAITPSADWMNRATPSQGSSFTYHFSDADDCKYTLSSLPASARSRDLPPPVVGHWADGMNGLVGPFIALIDTAWHLIVQPSFFASVFAIAAFVIAALATGLLMAMARFTWHPWLGATIFAVGTVALACVVAWCLQITMEGGLYLFGRITGIAGLCCGAAGITGASYTFFLKVVEVQIHENVDKLVPH